MKRIVDLPWSGDASAEAALRSAEERERELLRMIALRDRAALKDLYLLYHRRLSRFLQRFVHRQDLIDEIVNDTLFVVWTHVEQFRGDSRVSTWIVGIAYRRALKHLRRRHADSSDVDPSRLRAAADVAKEGEDSQWIERALQELPLEQRICLELAYVLGHSCEEISEVLGCPVNTVKTRMFHARRKLRASLPRLAGEG
ncbi:MAG TPA: sigma-70 family RNA polymerase sigma factor [Steroidobacter sp.]|nr:sigma-70 family RNA polymerase sigma factor [Steroidobacteraceae bacterium]HLS81107.1 sigma-70 family RNA polymerase sigma factor [Steroidobacter sp.]